MPQQVRIFNSPTDWHQFGAGEGDALPAPYDGVWGVTQGALTIRSNGYTLSAQKGNLVHIPAGSPGFVEADDELELVLAAHPPRWTLDQRDWQQVRAQPRGDARPRHFPATVPAALPTTPRLPESAPRSPSTHTVAPRSPSRATR